MSDNDVGSGDLKEGSNGGLFWTFVDYLCASEGFSEKLTELEQISASKFNESV